MRRTEPPTPPTRLTKTGGKPAQAAGAGEPPPPRRPSPPALGPRGMEVARPAQREQGPVVAPGPQLVVRLLEERPHRRGGRAGRGDRHRRAGNDDPAPDRERDRAGKAGQRRPVLAEIELH